MCNGGCECGCAGTCNSTICSSTGGCCGACNACPPPPPPSCGCGELILSGETCINGVYFLVDTSNNVYYQFNFGYVLATPITGSWSSTDEEIANLIAFYYNLIPMQQSQISNQVPSYMYLTQTLPNGVVPALSNYCFAQNCFLWPNFTTAGPGEMFSSYDIIGCSSYYPSSNYPNGSTPY